MLSTAINGYFAGGQTPSRITDINKVAFASLGNAHTFGDLTVARQEAGGVSDTIRGVAAGGYPGPSQTPTRSPRQHAIGRGYSGIQVNQGASNGGGVYLGSGKETGSAARACVIFPVPMRAIPSCAASDLLADDEVSATSANTVSSVLASSVEPDRGRIQFTGGSYSSGTSISLATNASSDSYLEGSSEL